VKIFSTEWMHRETWRASKALRVLRAAEARENVRRAATGEHNGVIPDPLRVVTFSATSGPPRRYEPDTSWGAFSREAKDPTVDTIGRAEPTVPRPF